MKKVDKVTQLTPRQITLAALPFNENLNKGAKNTFEQETIYQFINDKKIPLFNYIYNDLYYGRKNDKNQSILPNTQYIVRIENVNTNQSCFNFVADAFRDFKNKWISYVNQGIVNEKEELNILPTSGYVNFEVQYEQDMQEYYQIFLEFVKQKNLSKEILNFKTFLRVFSKFVSANTPANPISLSKWVQSKYCPVNVNGLTLSLDDKDSNFYSDKQAILNNSNFRLFNETVNLYGFIVDKNEPWKIHFNINSPVAKTYISKYAQQSTKFFDQFYIKINQYDIYFLKKYIYSFYKKYSDNERSFVETKLETCNDNVYTKMKKVTRPEITVQQINTELNKEIDKDWWRFYLFTRSCEANLAWNQETFNAFVKNSFEIYSSLDFFSGLSYIEQQISSGPLSKEKTRNYQF